MSRAGRALAPLGAAAAIACAAVAGFSVDAARQSAVWPPTPQKAKPGAAPLSPADEQKTLIMPPGYRVELVASEPMVVDPVAIDFDPDGRMWVVEMLGFMPDTSGADSREPTGRIVVLEDEDDDGRMDRRTVFLDKLILPRAVKVLDRGVLVGEPPYLWLARDTDGDLDADAKKLVRDDYGRLEGNPEHNANGLHWGLDNVIYTSEHSYHLELTTGGFRIQPTLARGQWGISSDDAGRIYRNWNEQPLFVDMIAPRYFMRNPQLARTRGLYERLMETEDMTVWPVRETRGVNRGYRDGVLRSDGTLTTYVSAGTPTIYRGDRLPSDLYGNAFITESAGNLVHRLVIADDGVGRLSARNAYPRGEFLASTDERFRPVNLFSGPDGTLYVVDMYRGVIQDGQYWTDYLRDYIRTNNLELPVGLGRIWRVVHDTTIRDRRPALSKATVSQLVARLAHPNGWHRDTAQRLLVERSAKSAVRELRRMAGSHTDWRARLHALWTLDGLQSTDAQTVARALGDSSPDVRASAVRLAERWLKEPDHPLREVVLSLTRDANWIVRRQLAASVGELPETERVRAITAALKRHGEDPVTVDAAISGLRGHELDVLERLLDESGGLSTPSLQDPIGMLAATVARGRDANAVSRVLDFGGTPARPLWQRVAVLRGVDLALSPGGVQTGAGRGGGRSASGADALTLAAEPTGITALIGTPGELGTLAADVADLITWPGRRKTETTAAPLTPDEQNRFARGQEIYKSLCSACHQPDGRGGEALAPSLLNSRLVVEDPGIPARIVLAGKEGRALMPPLGASLTDEQVASVLTYIRRGWGHTASPVSAADVKEIRGMTASRKRPWTDDELSKLATVRRAGSAR